MIKSTVCAVMSSLVLLTVALPLPAVADEPDCTTPVTGKPETTSQDPTESEGNKRIFGIIPNNRTSDSKEHCPLTPKEKFRLASEDTFDWGTYMLAAAFAGYGQLRDSTPAYGHGVPGYARYWVASYSDLAIGNVMTEAVFPTILHQDPRYFRRGTGSKWARLGFAAGQIFATHGNSGATEVNFSEILGNLTAVGISNAYYPDTRDVPNNALKFGIQIATDMTANVLKEFWPDLSDAFSGMFHGKSP
jgi:hypothetical protein